MDGEQSGLKQYADRLEFACRSQMKRIAELEAEVQRLRAEVGAHAALKDVYLNPDSSETNKIKAASASLPFEKPKLMSVVPTTEVDRKERWRAWERFRLKAEILRQTSALPGPGWDAKLVGDTYEPPAEGEPEWDLFGEDQFKAHVAISDLIDAAERRKRNGNGDDSND